MKLRDSSLNQVIKKTITVHKNATLLDARSILLHYKISRIVVVDGERPVGILTEKDLVRSVYSLTNKPIEGIKVHEVMSRRLITASEDATIYDCAKLMLENKVSSVIILKNDGGLAGIITKTDLASIFLTQSTYQLQISKIMTKKVVTAKPADSLLYVENLLVRKRVSRIVVERDGKPVGVITHRDFIPAKIPLWLRNSGDSDEVERYRMARRPPEFDMNQLSYLSTFIAADIMTPNPITVLAKDDVSEAALLMIRNGISGLPVVKNALLVGIITKTDIVKAIAMGSTN